MITLITANITFVTGSQNRKPFIASVLIDTVAGITLISIALIFNNQAKITPDTMQLLITIGSANFAILSGIALGAPELFEALGWNNSNNNNNI